MEQIILTPADVAEKLGICLPTVYKMLRNQNLPYVRAGDRFLIPSRAFEKWLECQQPITK